MGEINGLIRAANALHYYERRQEALSNNLANASTAGFKAQRVFGRLVGDALTTADARTDASAGALRQTNGPLDMAIGGEGYFVVQTPNGERFTRNGSFQIDPSGQLTDAGGNAVLGESGPITVPSGGSVALDSAGTLRVDSKEIGKLRIESVPAGTQMQHEGGTLFVPDASRQPVADADRKIKQGFVEESNVNTIGSMVDMISIQRAYQAIQRTVVTLDEIRGTISNQLGKAS